MIRVLLLLCACCVPALANASSAQAQAWLDRMSDSFRLLNYEGSFTYEQGSSIEALKITHAVFDGREYERLVHMDGEPREIMRRGHSVKCLHPGHQLLKSWSAASSEPLAGSGIERYYEFSIAGKDRVAGRAAVEVAVRPLDTHRFGHRFALDEETGLLLRAKLYGPKNQVLERFQFVELKVGHAISRQAFEAEQGYYEAGHGPMAELTAHASAEKLWRPAWLPGGFGAAEKQTANDMMSFTDGLAVFSIFVEALAEGGELSAQGTASKGATVAYSRAILLNGAPHRVTVVGEIPVATAKRIADSVEALK